MLGRSIGLTDVEIAAIGEWRGSHYFDDKDRAVLAYTDSVSENNSVPNEIYDVLGEHFDEKETMKICIAVTFAGLVNRVHATFRTELDPSTLAAVEDAPFCLIHNPT